MKKIFNTLALVLLVHGVSYGQQIQNANSRLDKIHAVLAQQPAWGQSDFMEAMRSMEGFSTADFTQLLLSLKPQGGDNAALEYATNSYALYVMQPGKDALRQIYVAGLLAALDTLADVNNKGYLLELLKFCAKNEAVDRVARYLNNPNLMEKAARVLTAIHSPESIAALRHVLIGDVTEKQAIAIVAALGELKATAV